MDYVIRLLEAVAWPVAIVWLGYIFRGDIQRLLKRVNQLKYRDLEANFEKELAAAEEEAKKYTLVKKTSEPIGDEPLYPPPYDELYERLLRIAEESSRAALLEAWTEVEVSLGDAADRCDVYNSKHIAPRRLLMELISRGFYPKTVLPLFEDLRALRNEAAHATEFIPSRQQTRRYLQLAIELALTFKQPSSDN